MFDLTGKCALITGASGGIGAAIARTLHGAGATVGLSGTREAPLHELAAALGDRTHVLPCNLSDAAAVDALPKQAEDAMGSLDILINNAGLTRDNLFMRMKDEEWDEVIRVNLTAAFRLSRGVLRGMMKRRWGRIIGITSVVGVMGNPGQGNYAASKAGLVGMTKTLSKEWGRYKVNVNCVAFGFIKTRLTQPLTGEGASIDVEGRKIAVGVQPAFIDAMEKQMIPIGRAGTPEEAADGVYLFCTPESNYISGQVVIVGGGVSL